MCLFVFLFAYLPSSGLHTNKGTKPVFILVGLYRVSLYRVYLLESKKKKKKKKKGNLK